MRTDSTLPWLAGGLMLFAAMLGWLLQPDVSAARAARSFQPLEASIPLQFGEWQIESSAPPPLVPLSEHGASRLYDEVMVRTYRSARGERVMLSIAHGGEQRGNFKAHRPDFCYRGQGFDISRIHDDVVVTAFGPLPVQRMYAHSWQRDEPITYWMTLGDRVLMPGVRRHLAMFGQSLSGEVADGMLVRVSSLGADAKAGWDLQDGFLSALVAAMSDADRMRIAGLAASTK